MSDDFFTPGTTYLANNPYRAPEDNPQFQCEAVADHPSKGTLRALGFWRRGAFSPWVSIAFREEHYDKCAHNQYGGWIAARSDD